MIAKDEYRLLRKHLIEQNRKYGDAFVDFPKEQWPTHADSQKATRVRVCRNKQFLIQIFKEGDCIRISVNRTAIQRDGNWEENISWDQLRDIKAKLGYGDREAIELFPAEKDIVNVANIRHLWIMPKPLPCVWRKNG